MGAINDPVAIKFVNEQVRPLCERARALMAEIEAANVDWFGGLNNQFPNDGTLVDDGRDKDGVSRLTGADINNTMSVLGAIANQKNDQILAKPCVRPLTAT